MQERRIPDPTLSILSDISFVEVEQKGKGQRMVAHLPDSDHALGHLFEKDDAQWFSVPCKLCFPYAPEPGHLFACLKDRCTSAHLEGDSHSYLSWQKGRS